MSFMNQRLLCVFAAFPLLFGIQVESVSAQSDTAESVAGVYESTRPPEFPFPGTDTITLSKDGSFRFDMALSQGKMATFLGTWKYLEGKVLVVTTERLLEGKPHPPTNPDGWKPGHEMNMRIEGNKLFKSETSKQAFTKVSE
jgi:hypothetical protein